METLTGWRISIGTLDTGVRDNAGVEWFVDNVEGWGSPASTLEVTQRPRGHGGWSGDAYLTPRSLAVSGWILAPTEADLLVALDRLYDAVALEPALMTVVQGQQVRTILVRRADEIIVEHPAGATRAKWSFQVTADDPRKYGAALTASTFLPSSSGGLTWPVTWPITWTGITETGVASLFNAGNVEAPLRARIFGPVTGPSLTHVQTQRVLAFSPTFVINAGSFVDVDMQRREVLEGGQATRNGSLISRGWFNLSPGANDIGFNATSFDTSAAVTFTSWSAWK